VELEKELLYGRLDHAIAQREKSYGVYRSFRGWGTPAGTRMKIDLWPPVATKSSAVFKNRSLRVRPWVWVYHYKAG